MPLSANAANQNATTSRFLNKMNYAFSNIADDIGTATTSDIVVFLDADDNYEAKYGDASNVLELIGTTATGAELTRVADISARIVTSTATALSLTVTEHAERIVLIQTNSTVANTFTLPVAAGTGAKFTIVNDIVQTQGSVVVAANGTDIISGVAVMVDSTGADTSTAFYTTATSDKVTFNITTTGGLGGDKVVAYDVAANTWMVEVFGNGSGTMATPFSAT